MVKTVGRAATGTAYKGMLVIVDFAEVVVTSPDRNFVTLRLTV
jgi:hypothetical protein